MRQEIEALSQKWEAVAQEIRDFGFDSRLDGEEADVFWDTSDYIEKVVSKMLLVEGYQDIDEFRTLRHIDS